MMIHLFSDVPIKILKKSSFQFKAQIHKNFFTHSDKVENCGWIIAPHLLYESKLAVPSVGDSWIGQTGIFEYAFSSE
jgi:hypothetical protein